MTTPKTQFNEIQVKDISLSEDLSEFNEV